MTDRERHDAIFLKRPCSRPCAPLPLRPLWRRARAGRVVVIGGGFAGATCAGALKRLARASPSRPSSKARVLPSVRLANGVITYARFARSKNASSCP